MEHDVEVYNSLDEIHDMIGSLLFILPDDDPLYWDLIDWREAIEEWQCTIEDEIGEDDE